MNSEGSVHLILGPAHYVSFLVREYLVPGPERIITVLQNEPVGNGKTGWSRMVLPATTSWHRKEFEAKDCRFAALKRILLF